VVAIHWDLAREELRKARGMPVIVGLAADMPDAPVAVPAAPAAAAHRGPEGEFRQVGLNRGRNSL